MKTYRIYELDGDAYREAIYSVMLIVEGTLGHNPFSDGTQVDALAEELGIRFNEDGNIER